MKYLPALLLSAACLAAEGESAWDFQDAVRGWIEPAGAGAVIPEPGSPENRVYRIVATQPHHTQLVLAGSDATPDFVASLRFRLLASEGAAPGVYVYGRLSEGRFRGLTVQENSARAFCWFGTDQPAVTLGSVESPAALSSGAWLQAKVACVGDHLFAKIWRYGGREPGWQIAGQCPGQPAGRFALGVWTSPRQAATAEVLFDDVSFRPLTPADLSSVGIRVEPRPRLPTAELPAGRGTFETAGLIGICTERTVLAFERETGAIAHVIDRSTGQEFISPSVFRPLFRLGLSRSSGRETLPVSADELAATWTAAGGALRGRFTGDVGDAGFPLAVEVEVTADPAGMFRIGARVRQDADWAVARVDLPLMAHPAALGDNAEEDSLVLPWADGSVLHAPGSLTQSRSAVYPGHAFTQFTALYNRTAGLFLAAFDDAGHCKRWDLRTATAASVEMTLSHLRPEVPAPVAELPYDVVLGTFQGEWRDAADIYRNWAARQWWCATPLRDRQDIPGFLKEGSAIVIGSVQATEARERLIGADLERLPELTAAYRARTGLPHIVFVPYGWENRGTWAGINYLPAVPSNEAWQRANAALRAQGDRTAFLTSGYWWVVKRQQTQNGPAFDDSEQFERRRDMVIHQADGTPFLVRNYDQLAEHGNWRGLSAALCRGSSQAADWMRGVFLEVARLGVPLISFDQDIGGGQVAPCYHPDHGHPPGYGNWMWTGFRDVCRDILEQGRTFAPELGLFLENVSELAIPWMATYWSRQFGEVEQGAIGARGVGLFSYLYHDYVTAIGAACVQGQGQQGTRPHPGLRRVVLANNLVRGLVPGPFITDVPLEPSSDWHREIAPAFFSYCRPYARFPEYLLLGRTARPPRVTSADVPLWFYRQDPQGEPLRPGGPKVLKVPISLPAVVAGSFTAADGSTATVLANTTPEEQQAAVDAGGMAGALTLFDAERQPLRQWQAAPGEAIPIVLEPLGTRVLVAIPRR